MRTRCSGTARAARGPGGRGARVALAALVVVAVCAASAMGSRQQIQAAASGYKEVGHWGTRGLGNGQFGSNAFGLATDKAGNVYVADSDQHRIQVFTSKGAFKSKFAFDPSSEAQDVAIDPDGSVWGTDLQGAQALHFGAGGGSLAPIATPKSAVGIAVDAQGNVYVSTQGDNVHQVVRFDKATSYAAGKTWGGFQSLADVEVSPDGSIYVVDDAAHVVKRFDSNGKLLKAIKAGASTPIGIGVDLDCNVLVTNIAQRNVEKFSPSGKPLGTAASADLIGQDVAVGPTGDLYVFDSGKSSVIHFAEDHAQPQAATIVGAPVVTKAGSGYVAKVRYALTGVACPAQIDATASLAGKGIAGKARVKVAAGKTTVIAIPVKGTAGAHAGVTFKIVLKTNGRATTQSRAVNVNIPG